MGERFEFSLAREHFTLAGSLPVFGSAQTIDFVWNIELDTLAIQGNSEPPGRAARSMQKLVEPALFQRIEAHDPLRSSYWTPADPSMPAIKPQQERHDRASRKNQFYERIGRELP